MKRKAFCFTFQLISKDTSQDPELLTHHVTLVKQSYFTSLFETTVTFQKSIAAMLKKTKKQKPITVCHQLSPILICI